SIALAFAYLCVGGPLRLDVSLTDPTTWLADVALLQKWLGRPNVWEGFWSLHFEVAFYVICSVLFACRLLHLNGAKTFAVLLILFALVCTAKLLRMKNPTDYVYHWIIVLSAPLGLLASRYVAGRVSRRAFYGLLAGVCGTLFYVWCLNHLLY